MARAVYLTLGTVFTALGFIGAFIPLLPTVPFLLLAVMCFARSSQRFHDWLYHHPRYGPAIQAWVRYGAVPVRAKVMACIAMALSMILLISTTQLAGWIYLVVAGALTVVALWLCTRPSAPRADDSAR